MTEEQVAEATAGEDEFSHRPIVKLRLTEHGGELFAAVTRENLRKRLAAVVDGKVVSAPMIQSVIHADVVISGDFTREEAERIAKSLNSYREKVRAFLREMREKGPEAAGG